MGDTAKAKQSPATQSLGRQVTTQHMGQWKNTVNTVPTSVNIVARLRQYRNVPPSFPHPWPSNGPLVENGPSAQSVHEHSVSERNELQANVRAIERGLRQSLMSRLDMTARPVIQSVTHTAWPVPANGFRVTSN